VALSASVFCSAEFLPVGLLRFVSASLGVSEGTAGTMVTAPGVLAAIAAPLVTVAIGNQDRKRVLLGLGLLLVLSNLLGLLAPNYGTLLLGRVLFGVGLGGFWAIGVGLGGRLVPAESAGKATSIIFAGVSIGMLVGGAAGALIGETLGWRAAFGVSLLLSLVAVAAQAVYLPSLRVEQRVRARDLLGIAMTRDGRMGLIAMLLVLSGQFATYTYITPLLAQTSAFSGKVIPSILLGYTVIGMLGNFLGGAGPGRDVKTTLATAMLFIAIPVALLPFVATSQPGTLALLALWGIAYGAMPVALQIWMVRAAPNASEGAMALFVANFQVSIALGSFVGGLVVDQLGLNQAMVFGALVAAVGLAVLWLGAARRASLT
jgi:predicted MFS family arabinose efflux permease